MLGGLDMWCRAARLEMSTHCLERGMPCSVLAARMLAPAVCPIPIKIHHTSSLVAQLLLQGMMATISSRPASEEFETKTNGWKHTKAAAHCSDKEPQAESVPVPQ